MSNPPINKSFFDDFAIDSFVGHSHIIIVLIVTMYKGVNGPQNNLYRLSSWHLQCPLAWEQKEESSVQELIASSVLLRPSMNSLPVVLLTLDSYSQPR